jgi:hypothetical protein
VCVSDRAPGVAGRLLLFDFQGRLAHVLGPFLPAVPRGPDAAADPAAAAATVEIRDVQGVCFGTRGLYTSHMVQADGDSRPRLIVSLFRFPDAAPPPDPAPPATTAAAADGGAQEPGWTLEKMWRLRGGRASGLAVGRGGAVLALEADGGRLLVLPPGQTLPAHALLWSFQVGAAAPPPCACTHGCAHATAGPLSPPPCWYQGGRAGAGGRRGEWVCQCARSR